MIQLLVVSIYWRYGVVCDNPLIYVKTGKSPISHIYVKKEWLYAVGGLEGWLEDVARLGSLVSFVACLCGLDRRLRALLHLSRQCWGEWHVGWHMDWHMEGPHTKDWNGIIKIRTTDMLEIEFSPNWFIYSILFSILKKKRIKNLFNHKKYKYKIC